MQETAGLDLDIMEPISEKWRFLIRRNTPAPVNSCITIPSFLFEFIDHVIKGRTGHETTRWSV